MFISNKEKAAIWTRFNVLEATIASLHQEVQKAQTIAPKNLHKKKEKSDMGWTPERKSAHAERMRLNWVKRKAAGLSK